MSLALKRLANTRYAIRYYKKPIIIVSLLLVLLLSTCAFCAGSYNDAKGLVKLAVDQVDNICGYETIGKVSDLVEVSYTNGTLTMAGRPFENLTLFTTINKAVAGIAFCMLTLTFFVGFLNARGYELTAEQLMIRFGLFIGCMVLIFKAQDLCLSIANVGTLLADKVEVIATSGDVAESNDEIVSSIKQIVYEECQTDDDGFLANLWEGIQAIGVYLQLFIPSIAMMAVSVICNVICWSRALEIVILSSFSPLAFCDASDLSNFGHGSGSRFIKNMAALSISGAIILFILALCSSLSLEVLNNAINNGFSEFVKGTKDVMVIGFAQVGLVLKANSISKTIMGVG